MRTAKASRGVEVRFMCSGAASSGAVASHPSESPRLSQLWRHQSASAGLLLWQRRPHSVFDFARGGVPEGVEEVELENAPSAPMPRDPTLGLTLRVQKDALTLGPDMRLRWAFERDGSAVGIVPSTVGLALSLPPFIHSNTSAMNVATSSSLEDYSIVLDLFVDAWPPTGRFLCLFASLPPTDLTNLMAPAIGPAPTQLAGVWLDSLGRVGIGAHSAKEIGMFSTKSWHRLMIVRNSTESTLTLRLNDRTVVALTR